MNWLRSSIQLILAGLGYAEGVLTALAYTHRHSDKLAIFMASGFSLGLILSISIFFKDSAILILIQCVIYAFFFASSAVLVFFFSSTLQNIKIDQIIFPPHIFQTILLLALFSMAMIGFSLAFTLVSKYVTRGIDTNLPRDPESDTTGWHSELLQAEELSLNKSHRISFQPPFSHLGLEGHQLTEKTLRNKDSEGTLVVPDLAGEDDVSLSWIVQASMSTHHIYENTSENWMNSRPLKFDVDDNEVFKRLATHGGVSFSKSNFNQIYPPKVRVSRSNTTGLLLASKKNLNSSATPSSYVTAKRSRSVSFTSGLLQKQISEMLISGDTFHSKKEDPLENDISEKDEEAFSPSKDDKDNFLMCGNTTKQVSKIAPQSKSEKVQDFLPPKPNSDQSAPKSYMSFSLEGSKEMISSKDNQSLLSPEIHRVLYSAFEPQNNDSSTSSPDASLLEESILDELESIPMAVHSWESHNSLTAMKNISLQDWEDNKDQWLQLRKEGTPVFFSSNSNRRLAGSFGAISAPSLHTYREQSDHRSGNSNNANSTLNDALYRCVTPPQRDTSGFTELMLPDSSPIKKMIGRFKRKDSSVEIDSPVVLQKHKHSNSIATSMISMASGISSRSGSPRKTRKMFFPKTLLDQQQKIPPPLNFATLPRKVGISQEDTNLSPKPGFLISTDKFWDVETGEFLDKSRVSSVPSAVIGEYDREKWRTMKELEKNSEAT